jgi:hypothetical protein
MIDQDLKAKQFIELLKELIQSLKSNYPPRIEEAEKSLFDFLIKE